MKNFFDFTGKVVLVTGASSGIGRATAECFGRCGASVAISYLKNRAGADAVVAAISNNGHGGLSVNPSGPAASAAPITAMAVQVDVTINSEVERMVRAVEKEMGAINILV